MDAPGLPTRRLRIVAQTFLKWERDSDAISHDRATPRLGSGRGLRSLTRCAHPRPAGSQRGPRQLDAGAAGGYR